MGRSSLVVAISYKPHFVLPSSAAPYGLSARTGPPQRYGQSFATATFSGADMWIASPSSQWTLTTYSLPVSRRTHRNSQDEVQLNVLTLRGAPSARSSG